MEKFVKLSSGDHQQSVSRSYEEVPLLQKTLLRNLQRKYRTNRKCVTSKAAALILVCTFPVSLIYLFLLNPNSFEAVPQLVHLNYLLIPVAGFSAVVYCFYPLAGHLADNKFGRYKTVLTSLWMLFLALFLSSVGGGVLLISLIVLHHVASYGIFITIICIGAIITFVGFILMIISFVGFYANVIQFGLDQLHDSPGEDQSLFIHWCVWMYYVAQCVVYLMLNISQINYPLIPLVSYCLLGSLCIFVIFLFISLLCVIHHRRNWFLIDPGRQNPYKLVYQVIRFACQHQVPLHRSAFTYCEDELPSGLDLGKNKYGGPFTTEQVEDVKAFYGILKVLLSFGLVSFLHVATDPVVYSLNGSNNTDSDSILYSSNTTEYVKIAKDLFLDNDMLYSLLVVICIPLYIFLLRPFIAYYIPGMLKRIGIGMIVVLLSLIFGFVLEILVHVENRHLGCIFNDSGDYSELFNNSTAPLTFTDYKSNFMIIFLTVQSTALALSNMLIYIALYEFICSQSPHSMKGLLIGLSYAIRGVFQTLSSVLVISFALGWHGASFPSCGMYYYLVNIGVGLVALLMHVCIARGYKYRERDEPCNVRRYVEDYYSKLPIRQRFHDDCD